MNRIVGAYRGLPHAAENSKYLKVIVPDGQNALSLSYAECERQISKSEIAVVPPQTAYEVKGNARESVTVFIEQPLLPLKSVTVIEDVANGGIRSAAEQAETFFKAENGASVLNALGELIVSYIVLQSGKAEKSPVVAMLREDIEKNARDWSYSVETYIRKLPLNYDYVRKLFKKETGLTPHEYLTSVRMERAGKILLSGVSNRYSSFTVGQIAEACGYAEPLYFSRVFKKYFGISPTEYAKRRQ